MNFIEKLQNGLIGVFDIYNNSEKNEKIYGSISLNERNLITINGISDNFETNFSDFILSDITGRTLNEEIILLDISKFQPSRSFNHRKDYHFKIEAEGLIFGTNAKRFKDLKIKSLSLRFDNMYWLGYLNNEFILSEEKEYQVLDSIEILDKKFSLTSFITYNRSFGFSKESINGFLGFHLESSNGELHLSEFIPLVNAIQDIISISYRTFIPLQEIDAMKEAGQNEVILPCNIWSNSLMSYPLGMKTHNTSSPDPLFGYSTMGGINGLKTWIENRPKFLHAIHQISPLFKDHGRTTIQAKMLSIGTGLEAYFSASDRNDPDRRKAKKIATDTILRENGFSQRTPVQTFAVVKAGSSFDNFLDFGKNFDPKTGQDIDKKIFIDLITIHYNSMKHDASILYDISETQIIASVAEILLEGIIFKTMFPQGKIDEMLYQQINPRLIEEVKKLIEIKKEKFWK